MVPQTDRDFATRVKGTFDEEVDIMTEIVGSTGINYPSCRFMLVSVGGKHDLCPETNRGLPQSKTGSIIIVEMSSTRLIVNGSDVGLTVHSFELFLLSFPDFHTLNP